MKASLASCGRPSVLALSIALIYAVPQPSIAQTGTLEPVVVSGATEPTPAAGAQSVPPAQIRSLRSATSDTASLLRDVPGVSLYGAGGVSSLPVIRGLADDRLRVKLDGMDLIATCPNHMNPALSYIDPTNVGNLTVYAGITPVSVGGDSIGGAIVANTRAPAFAAPGQGNITGGEVGAFYRSNNAARGANLSLVHATEAFSIAYDGAWSRADNYTAGGAFKTTTATGRNGHTLPLDEVGSTAYRTGNHTLGVAFRGDGHLFEARLGYQDMPYQLFPNQRMDLLAMSSSASTCVTWAPTRGDRWRHAPTMRKSTISWTSAPTSASGTARYRAPARHARRSASWATRRAPAPRGCR